MKSFLELDVKSGQFRTFYGDWEVSGKVKRVSKIYPANAVLRVLFRLLRWIFGDEGKVADWTRRWHCEWIVQIGERKWRGFTDRQKAIEFEREEFLRELFP